MQKLTRKFARGRIKKVSLSQKLTQIKENQQEAEIQEQMEFEKEKIEEEKSNLYNQVIDVMDGTSTQHLDQIKVDQHDQVASIMNLDEFEGDLTPQQQAKKHFYLERQKFAKQDLVDEMYSSRDEKLVQRPAREAVWGLGGQLLKRKESEY